MKTPARADAAQLEEFNAFYNGTHLGEVVARHGFAGATRYELVDAALGSEVAPRWLAVYEMGDEAVAQGYVQRNGGAPPGRPPYTPGPPIWRQAEIAWRVIWRPLSLTGSASDPPAAIFTVGMDVPDGTDPSALAEFNAFYTDVHVPEVMAWGSFSRAIRFERYRVYGHPGGTCPRFCAVYEATTDGHRDRPRPTWSKGPPAWEGHQTRWRLWYRRVTR